MEQQTIQEEEKQQQEPQKSSFLSDVAEILETVFVSMFVVILLFAYVVRPVTGPPGNYHGNRIRFDFRSHSAVCLCSASGHSRRGFHAGNPARQGSSADV